MPQKSGGIASRACLAPDIDLLRKPLACIRHFYAKWTVPLPQSRIGCIIDLLLKHANVSAVDKPSRLAHTQVGDWHGMPILWAKLAVVSK